MYRVYLSSFQPCLWESTFSFSPDATTLLRLSDGGAVCGASAIVCDSVSEKLTPAHL